MDQAEKRRVFECLSRLAHGLATAIGQHCEVVVHDFADVAHSIVAIANGHVTGRKAGDSVDLLGLQILRQRNITDLINYRTTKSGQILRSSSVFLRDDNGEVFGAICVNLDVTLLEGFRQFLDDQVGPQKVAIHEGFEHSVDQVLEILVQDAIRATGKEVSAMERADKIAVISYLDSRGAFLIRHSVDRVAELLNISKYTIYNYLEDLKHKHGAEAAKIATVGEP